MPPLSLPYLTKNFRNNQPENNPLVLLSQPLPQAPLALCRHLQLAPGVLCEDHRGGAVKHVRELGIRREYEELRN